MKKKRRKTRILSRKYITLNHAIDNHGDGIDIELLCNKVKERLPEFNLV